MHKLFRYTLAILFTSLLIGCGQNAPTPAPEPLKEQSLPVKIAATEISYSILEPGMAWIKSQGVDATLILMDGNVNVIRAVNDGSADAALGVHLRFMNNFNAQNNGNLVMVEPYPFTTGIGLYSEKHTSLDALPESAQIAIMNDAMNMDRGLRMLATAGLISLDTNKAEGFSLLDIASNPKNFKFIDMNQVQTVRALQDVDASVIFFTHMKNAGKDYRSYLLRDSDAELYPMGIVIHKKNQDKAWPSILAKALRQDSVRQFVEEKFDGVFEYYD